MAGINKVIIVGNLGKDPDVRFLPNGGAVANITVATSETWKDKQTGEQKEKTEWHRIAIFGKLAEVAGEYLKKGSKVYIEGQLQTKKWQVQQGQDQYTTEVVVQGFNGTMQMLDGRGGNTQGRQQQGGFNQGQQQAPQQQGGFNQGQQQAPQQGFNKPQQQGTSSLYASKGQSYKALPQQHKQAPKVSPQEPSIDFDDDIPF